MPGGYDEGYRSCACFWGKKPGRLIRRLVASLGSVEGFKVIDAGCGEGKNAYYLATLGADVLAVDVSRIALRSAKRLWPSMQNLRWARKSIDNYVPAVNTYDIVILYGVLHCLASEQVISKVVNRFQAATKPGGFHVTCAFNDRRQDLTAHPGFRPQLLPHGWYTGLYAKWNLTESTDRDLWEIHPHNGIRHVHSMTRLIAQKTK